MIFSPPLHWAWLLQALEESLLSLVWEMMEGAAVRQLPHLSTSVRGIWSADWRLFI